MYLSYDKLNGDASFPSSNLGTKILQGKKFPSLLFYIYPQFKLKESKPIQKLACNKNLITASKWNKGKINPKENNWKWGNWKRGTKLQTPDYPKQSGGRGNSALAHFALTQCMRSHPSIPSQSPRPASRVITALQSKASQFLNSQNTFFKRVPISQSILPPDASNFLNNFHLCTVQRNGTNNTWCTNKPQCSV